MNVVNVTTFQTDNYLSVFLFYYVIISIGDKMSKLYKLDKEGKLLYAECWFDGKTFMLNTGTIGSLGESEFYACPKDFKTELEFNNYFLDKFGSEGYKEIPDEDMYWIVVQYPIKTIFGNKYNLLFKDKVVNLLDEQFEWKGLGIVDGFDIGKSSSPKNECVLNIFTLSVDEIIGVEVIKNALKINNLKYNKVKIATRKVTDDDYVLKYPTNKKDKDFYL